MVWCSEFLIIDSKVRIDSWFMKGIVVGIQIILRRSCRSASSNSEKVQVITGKVLPPLIFSFKTSLQIHYLLKDFCQD